MFTASFVLNVQDQLPSKRTRNSVFRFVDSHADLQVASVQFDSNTEFRNAVCFEGEISNLEYNKRNEHLFFVTMYLALRIKHPSLIEKVEGIADSREYFDEALKLLKDGYPAPRNGWKLPKELLPKKPTGRELMKEIKQFNDYNGIVIF